MTVVVASDVDGDLLVSKDWPIGCTLANPEGDELGDVAPGDKVDPGEEAGDVVDCCCGATPAEPDGGGVARVLALV